MKFVAVKKFKVVNGIMTISWEFIRGKTKRKHNSVNSIPWLRMMLYASFYFLFCIGTLLLYSFSKYPEQRLHDQLKTTSL